MHQKSISNRDKEQLFRKFVSMPFVFIVILSLAVPPSCLSFSPISNLAAQETPTHAVFSNIVIPQELASVKERFTGTSTDLFVIHIQDAHTVFDAQQNIQLLISEIENQFGPVWVGLEGGEGSLDSVLFRAFPEKDIRQNVFEKYLRRGEISGAEYAAIVNKISSRYYGVEDLHLYEENRLAFLNAARNTSSAERNLLLLTDQLNKLKDRLYSPALRRLEKKIDGFRHDAEKMESLLSELSTIVPHDKYPTIRQLISLGNDTEQQTAGTVLAKLNPEALESELEAYISAAKEVLFSSPDDNLLSELSDKLSLLLNMARLNLTKQEWKYYSDNDGQFGSEQFAAFLNRFGVPMDIRWDLKAHEQFYELAYRRDAILTDNFLSLLKSKKAAVGIFISGGFHTDGLTRLLKKEGISYLVLTPRIFSLDDASKYSNVMRGAVSYQDLLTVQDDALAPMLALAPKMAIYKSFRTHASYQLTQQVSAPKVLGVLRNWRDEVIREAFRQGRVESARQYTRLIDEWYELLSERVQTEDAALTYDEIIEALEKVLTQHTAAHFTTVKDLQLAKFEKFADDLRRLSQEGNLSLENISALINTFERDSRMPKTLLGVERKAGFGLNKADLESALDGLRDELQINEARQRDSDLRNAQLKIENERLLAEVTALRRLRNEAYTDALTGLHNRKFYEERMGTLLALSQREDIPISLIAIDADRFKEINDTNGHNVGDVILKFIADHLKRVARRRSDIGAARLGGEEFMIILPSTTLEQAAKIAERLRANIASDINRVTVKGTIPATGDKTDNRPVTISAGVVQLKKGETAKELYERADKALYLAKEQGRNQVITENELDKATRPGTPRGFGAVPPESEGGKPLETTISISKLPAVGDADLARVTTFSQLLTILRNGEIPLADILARFSDLLDTTVKHAPMDAQAAKDILTNVSNEITKAVGEWTYQDRKEIMEDLRAYAHAFLRFRIGPQSQHPHEWQALNEMLNRAARKNGDNLKTLASDILNTLDRMIETVLPKNIANYFENAISEEEIKLSNMLTLQGREIVTNAIRETFAYFKSQETADFNIGAAIVRGSVARDQAVTWSDVDLDILTTDGKDTYISKFLEILEETIYTSLLALRVERRTIQEFNLLKVQMRSAYLERDEVKTVKDLDSILKDIVERENDTGGKLPYILVTPDGHERGFGILRANFLAQVDEMSRLQIQALARELGQVLKAVGHFEFFELKNLLREYGIEIDDEKLLDLFVELNGIEFISRRTGSKLQRSQADFDRFDRSAEIENTVAKMPNSDQRRQAENKVAVDLFEKIALPDNPTESVTIFYTLETFPRDPASILEIAQRVGPHGRVILGYETNESISFLSDLVSKSNPLQLTSEQQNIILNRILRHAQTYTGRLETNKVNKLISSARSETQGVAMIIPGPQIFDRGSVRQVRTEQIVVEDPAIITEFNWMKTVSSNLANRLAQLDGALTSARRRGDVEAVALLERQIAQLLNSLAEYGFERTSDGRGGRVIIINLAKLLAKIQEAYTAFEQVRVAA